MSTTERFLIALGMVFAIPYLITLPIVSPTLTRMRMAVGRIA